MTTDADWFRTQCQIHRSIEDEMLALIERQAAEIAALTAGDTLVNAPFGGMYERAIMAERELASLRAAAAPPHEPTQAMLNAGRDVLYIYERALPRLEMAHDVWCAMYDAAPVAAPAPSDDARRNRATDLPGGMECEQCGCIFIGGAQHALCGICADAVRAGRASK